MKMQAKNPATLNLPAKSHPLGDWMPWNADVWGLMSDKPVTVILEPGIYGNFLGDEPVEMCTGSRPGHFHVRLHPQEGADA